ncbi:hypothetical protein IVB27_23625 [Bradyrhizobium sp. 197]|uniref:hypothetical protein n=1 Tax=Bradyrhizobium sp. 197 TaxID=2782663 RepID=UPI0031F6A933|nr:hypothetical protein [Bradyrhizobium sp. 197]
MLGVYFVAVDRDLGAIDCAFEDVGIAKLAAAVAALSDELVRFVDCHPGEKPRMSDFFTSASDAGFQKLGWIATRAAATTTIKPAITMAIFISPSRETSDHTTSGAL